MFLTVKKEAIIDGLNKAASIIPSKAAAAYLRTIWLQADAEPMQEGSLTLMATDVNIEFTGKYPAEVHKPGQAGINSRSFVELLRRLPSGEINLRLDEQASVLYIEQGKRKYKLPIADPVWYQPLSPFPEHGAILWSGDIFQELIDRVAFCISDDDSTEGLSCLYLKSIGDGRVDICGLNGHQFAMVRFINDHLADKIPETGLLIQKKYVNELKKWLGSSEIMLNISERRFHLSANAGSEVFSLPRSGYLYADYMNFISKLTDPKASILYLNRKECQDALDRLSIFNNESDRCTYFEFSTSDLVLNAEGQETGSATEQLEVDFKGDLQKIAFPTKNLLEILNHFTSDKLRFALTGAEGPCGITGAEDTEYTVLIMPMKIAEATYYTEE